MADPIETIYVDLRGRIGKLQQDMEGAIGVLTGTERKITGVVRGIEKTIKAALVVGGVVAVKKLVDAFGELAQKGEEAGSIAAQFEKLGGSASQIDKAKEAVLGVVDSFELMRIANEGMLKQIPEFNENFALIADYGGRVADALGRDVAESIKQVTDALATGRTKGLQQVGIIVDQDLAYREYAKTLGVVSTELTELQKREAIQRAGLEQLRVSLQRIDAMSESAANAQSAFNAAMGEATKEIGVGINANAELAKGWRALAKAVDLIDWEEVGKSVAELAATFLNIASKVLPVLVEQLNNVARGFNYLFGAGTQAQADRLAMKINDLQIEVAQMERMADPRLDDKLEKTREELAQSIEQFKGLRKRLEETTVAQDKLAEASRKAGEIASAAGAKSERTLLREQKEVEKAAKEIEKLRKEWTKLLDETSKDLLGKDFDLQLEKLARGFEQVQESFAKGLISRETAEAASDVLLAGIDFEGLKRKMYDSVFEGTLEGLKESIERGVVSEVDAERFARVMAESAAGEMEDALSEVTSAHGEEMRDTYRDVFGDASDYWRDVFSDAFDGTTKDLDTMLKELLAGFAGALAASVSGGITEGIKDIGDIGELIAKGLVDGFGELFSGSGAGTGEAIGQNADGTLITAAGAAEGSSWQAGAITAAIQAGVAASQAGDVDRQTDSHEGTGAAAGAAIGGAIGSIWGPAGAVIGAQLGQIAGGLIGGAFGRGATHPESVAREAFGHFVEDQFKALESIAFFDVERRVKTFNSDMLNFVSGAKDRFNIPEWDKQMDSWSETAKKTFLGLGEGLEEILELTEDVGGQIGFTLGENLAASVDNARLFVYQLGLSLDDIVEKLINTGLTGEMSWHEVEVAIQGATEAFKPGLEAVGDLKGALEELEGSGGRGAAAIKAIKDIAVEAMEAGARTIEELPAHLAAAGASEETINAIMGAIRHRGVQTLEELAEVSNRVGGGIVADIESASATMAETWHDMAEELDEVRSKLEALPEKLQSTVTIKVQTDMDSDARAAIDAINTGGNAIDIDTGTGAKGFANGGILKSMGRFRGVMTGERGAEAVLPLATLPNGKMGVQAVAAAGGKGMTVVVNAPNATPGMEHAIRREIEEMGEIAVTRAVRAVQDMNYRRGG